jgi:hypothetical protein
MTRRIALLAVSCAFFCLGAFAQDSYDDHLTRSKSLITQQQFSDAIKEAQKAIATDGQRWEAYVIAAKGYSSQRYYDDAIGMLQMALARAPDDKKPLVRDAIADCGKQQSQGNTSSSSGGISPQTPAAPTGSAAPAPTQVEIVLWKTIENSNNLDDFETYLKQYPNGTFAQLARNRLEKANKLRQEDDAKAKAEAEARRKAGDTVCVSMLANWNSGWKTAGVLNVRPGKITYSGLVESDKPIGNRPFFTAACSEVTDVKSSAGGTAVALRCSGRNYLLYPYRCDAKTPHDGFDGGTGLVQRILEDIKTECQ